jgi:hypothetical protein
VGGIGPKKRITKTTKHFKILIIWFMLIEFEVGSFVLKGGSRQPIDDINNSEESIYPISVGKMRMS